MEWTILLYSPAAEHHRTLAGRLLFFCPTEGWTLNWPISSGSPTDLRDSLSVEIVSIHVRITQTDRLSARGAVSATTTILETCIVFVNAWLQELQLSQNKHAMFRVTCRPTHDTDGAPQHHRDWIGLKRTSSEHVANYTLTVHFSPCDDNGPWGEPSCYKRNLDDRTSLMINTTCPQNLHLF